MNRANLFHDAHMVSRGVEMKSSNRETKPNKMGVSV